MTVRRDCRSQLAIEVRRDARGHQVTPIAALSRLLSADSAGGLGASGHGAHGEPGGTVFGPDRAIRSILVVNVVIEIRTAPLRVNNRMV